MENNMSKKIYKTLDEAKDISTTYPDKSYAMCEEVYHMSRKNHLKLEEGYALIGMAFAFRAKSEINKMMDYSYNALEIFEALQEPLGKIKSLNLIGIAYFYNSMYEQALNYLLQALDLLENLKDDFLLSSILNNIGEVYRESAKYETALEYYYRALETCLNTNSKIPAASLFNNIGEVYFMEAKYNKALKYFTKSYDMLIEEKNMIILGEVENKLGKVHFINENYSKAAECFSNSLRRLQNVDNKFYAIDVLVNTAKLHLKKDSTVSFYYFEKAIQYAEKINAKKKLSEIYKSLSEAYEKLGDFRNAMECLKKYIRVEQEIMTSIVGNKLEILKIELDHLKENEKLEKIKLINQRLEMEISNQRYKLDEIQKLNALLEKKAFEDELTCVPNRSYINYHLNETWAECMLYDKVIALFIIDIDNFKKYNDYWGHSNGDECLIKIANCIKEIQTERKDVFGRYGGEEFIYYAADINYDQALELGNLIRTKVENLYLKYTLDDNSGVVTISVGGVLGKPSNLINISSMIQFADKELYRAKNMGRNITLINNLIE